MADLLQGLEIRDSHVYSSPVYRTLLIWICIIIQMQLQYVLSLFLFEIYTIKKYFGSISFRKTCTYL